VRTMRVSVNGVATELDDDITVAALVRARTDERAKVAVARNGEVVPRSAWETTTLIGGDSVEVLVPVAGG
jgi:sulfur carrier protein